MLDKGWNLSKSGVSLFGLLLVIVLGFDFSSQHRLADTNESVPSIRANRTFHKYVEVDGLNIFYRESGLGQGPTILLLHGYPTSSRMFRHLLDDLGDEFHLIAPDFPGFGNSEQPDTADFEYSFVNYANLIERFLDKLYIRNVTIYLMDYGAPVGFIIAERHPENVDGLIIQNGNAFEEGLGEVFGAAKRLWKEKTPENREAIYKIRGDMNKVIWEYTHGVEDVSLISPDNWFSDFSHLMRPGNLDIQVMLVEDYGNNVASYPDWQDYMMEHQPPALIVWGKNDKVFPPSGAYPYLKYLNDVDFNLLNTGHFALEEKRDSMALLIRNFMHEKVLN